MNGGKKEVVTGQHRLKLQSRRHHRLHVLAHLRDEGVDLRCVGSGRLENHQHRAGVAVDVGEAGVTDRTDFHVRYVAQVQHVPAVRRAQHDVPELLHTLQCTFVLQRVLVFVLRPLAKRTRTDDETLAVDGGEHVVRSQAVLRHHIRFHPDAQRIRIAQRVHIAHTRDTLQTRLDIDVHVVGNKLAVILAVGAPNGQNAQDVVLLFLYRYAHFRHLRRKQRRGLGYAVLHVHCRHVGVGALLEEYRDLHVARGAGFRRHVRHVGYAVDTLFQRLNDRLHDCGRICTGVVCGDTHLRRRNVRILFDRQRLHADEAHQGDDNGNCTCHHIFRYEYITFCHNINSFQSCW